MSSDRTVSGVHWLGQGWEEDIPKTGSGGEILMPYYMYWYRNEYRRLPIIAIHVVSRFFVCQTNEICINYKQIIHF